MDKLLLAGTAYVSVPKKVVFYTKNGKMKEAPSLTPTGNITKRNKQNVIHFENNDYNYVQVNNKGINKHIAEAKLNADKYLEEINKLRILINEKKLKLEKMNKRNKGYNVLKKEIDDIENEIEPIKKKYNSNYKIYWEYH